MASEWQGGGDLRASRRLSVLVGVLLSIAGVACTSEDDALEPAAPQITEGADDPELTGSLISLAEIESSPQSPRGLIEQPVEDASLFENPDPRGPCGASVSQPAFKDAAIVAFSTTQPPYASINNAVWDLPNREAEEFLEAWREDIRPDCPPFVSKTPFGEQRAEFLKEIPLPELADDALAASSRIIVEGQPTLYAGAALLRDGTRLSIVSVFSEDPIFPRFIQAIAKVAADKL